MSPFGAFFEALLRQERESLQVAMGWKFTHPQLKVVNAKVTTQFVMNCIRQLLFSSSYT